MPPDAAASAPLRRIVRGACPHDCPDTCALHITVENGRAIKVEGAPDHPSTAGVLCTKVARYLDRTYAPSRLLGPLRRVGPKGSGRFAPVSWDDALSEIAARFREIAASTDGPQAILPYSYAGTMGLLQASSMDRRFFHRLGASLLDRTICSSAGKAGYAATIGASIGTDLEQFEHARLILIWGSNPIVSNLHLWTRVQAAKRRGAKLVAIDPYRSLTAEKCHVHLALRPGTDAALALGMMHVLIAEDLLDHDYIARYTLGFDALKVRASEYPPSRVAEITGLAAEDIVALARDYGTIKPAVIRLNYGMQRHAGGGMAIRTAACLPALVGAWRDAAGGVLLSSSGAYPVDRDALERPDLIWNHPRTINMSSIGDALLEISATRPSVRSTSTTPIRLPSPRIRRGSWRDFPGRTCSASCTTCSRPTPPITPTSCCRRRPSSSTSTCTRPMDTCTCWPTIRRSRQLGEARPNTEVFRQLAQRMGFTEPCFRDSDEEIARQAFRHGHPRMQGLEWERVKADGWRRLNVPASYAPFAEGNFPTPSGKCEFYSESLLREGIDPLPTFTPPRESVASNPALAARYPLAMISPPARHALNSSFANLPTFLVSEPTPQLEIHPDDAAARGIVNGERVRVFNDRGALVLTARVSTDTRPGVVVALSIWWRKLSPDGTNANMVTGQGLTDLGRGATFYDCLVEAQRLAA